MTRSFGNVHSQVAARSMRQRSGVVAAELALALPLIVLFALAAADFGRITHFRQVVSNAARTGAESGATHKFTAFTRAAWESEVYSAVLSEMQNIPGFNVGAMEYSLSTSLDSDNLARITVRVSYPFQTAVAWPGMASGVNLQETIEFRQFR